MAISRIGPYTVHETIGTGGQAVVYRATRDDQEQPIALKVLHPGLASDEASIDAFKREAINAQAVKHPNVARILDFDTADNLFYLAIEYLPGSLLQRIENDGRLRTHAWRRHTGHPWCRGGAQSGRTVRQDAPDRCRPWPGRPRRIGVVRSKGREPRHAEDANRADHGDAVTHQSGPPEGRGRQWCLHGPGIVPKFTSDTHRSAA